MLSHGTATLRPTVPPARPLSVPHPRTPRIPERLTGAHQDRCGTLTFTAPNTTPVHHHRGAPSSRSRRAHPTAPTSSRGRICPQRRRPQQTDPHAHGTALPAPPPPSPSRRRAGTFDLSTRIPPRADICPPSARQSPACASTCTRQRQHHALHPAASAPRPSPTAPSSQRPPPAAARP
jgi:hypothetical protein